MYNQIKLTALILWGMISMDAFGQSWSNGSSGSIYYNQGNVGIGSASPSQKLDVLGNIQFQVGNELGAHIASQRFTYDDKTLPHYGQKWIFDSWNTGAPTLWTSSYGGIKFFTSGKDRLSITNGGKVGIGTSSPLEKLDVRSGKIYLGSYDKTTNGVYQSYFHWFGHILIMGSRPGAYAHNVVQLKPGGASQGQLYSKLELFQANSESDIEKKVSIYSSGDSFFNGGNVGIGTASPDSKLAVNGNIRAREIKLEATNWPDYVFDEGYKRQSLEEIEIFINENGHLPGMKTAEEYQKTGVNILELNQKLLEKVEELTLQNINQHKKLNKMEAEIKNLRELIKNRL